MFLLHRVKNGEDSGELGQMLTEPGASQPAAEARASCLFPAEAGGSVQS